MAYVFKQLEENDYQKTPFPVYKEWEFNESQVGVDFMIFRGHLGNTTEYGAVTRSGVQGGYKAVKDTIFRQVRHLYYGGNPQDTGSESGQNVFETGSGWRLNSPFGTFGGSNDKEERTLEDTTVNWISISQPVFGDRIKPGSVTIKDHPSGITLKDDGIGNLYDANDTTEKVGNVFYEHGNIVITTGSNYEDICLGGYTFWN